VQSSVKINIKMAETLRKQWHNKRAFKRNMALFSLGIFTPDCKMYLQNSF
jgi:hypothetical protein